MTVFNILESDLRVNRNKIVAACISFVAGWEGVSYVVYKDIGGVDTVCHGQTGSEAIIGKVYSPQECSAMLEKELYSFADHVNNRVPAAPLSVKAAFTSFSYNVGKSGFDSSRAMREAQRGNYKEACRALAFSPSGAPAWSFVGKKYVQGLHNRRIAEMKFCMKDLNV